MRELYIKNLCIEITRRCNMRCAHCMRGDAESVDISLKHISNLLRHVRHIHHFNITGGEPSLNVRAIRHILGRVRAYGITVNDFYIVTNGAATSRSGEFIAACAALYEYQEEKEQDSGHMLEMSDDRFHDPAEHAATLAALSPYPFSESGDRPNGSSFSGKVAVRRDIRIPFIGFTLRRRTTFMAISVSMPTA